MHSLIRQFPRLKWLGEDSVRPYLFLRPQNHVRHPGRRHSQVDWFRTPPLHFNPFQAEHSRFADQILRIETAAFQNVGMAMPRWVFYDCALLPGFVCGFAMRREAAPESIRQIVKCEPQDEWLPLSLFVIIPAIAEGDWVAHNLTSVNSILPEAERFYGLGFLTKAFGLWYANIETCCGMTQWGNTALKLHSHYGDFEVLTSYTPIHTYATTMTYRLRVNASEWIRFFSQAPAPDFASRYRSTGIEIDPKSPESMQALQRRLEIGEGPFFLDANELRTKDLQLPLSIHQKV